MLITKTQNGTNWKLVFTRSGDPVPIGHTFHHAGETCIVTDFDPPRHEGSTGRVYVKTKEFGEVGYYPQVFGTKIVQIHLELQGYLEAGLIDNKLNELLTKFPIGYKPNRREWRALVRTIQSSLNIINESISDEEITEAEREADKNPELRR